METSIKSIGVVYCCVCALCGLGLCLDAHVVKKITPRFSIAKYVYLSFLFSGISAFADSFYGLREYHVFDFSEAASFAITLTYVATSTISGIYWLVYSENKQRTWFTKTNKRFLIFLAPNIISLLLVLSSPLTHFYFYFVNQDYQRGSLFLPISIINFAYILYTGVGALKHSFEKKNYLYRSELRRLFIYSTSILLIQAVQFALPNIMPYRTILTLFICEILLKSNMAEMIGVDAITHINNRYAAERYFDSKINENVKFGVATLDVDNFKHINDTYGHPEGDKALLYVAEALKNSVPSNYFIARIGGDEFIIIGNDYDTFFNNAENIINENLLKILEKNNRKYQFSISLGYTYKDETIDNIPDLKRKVDEQLYLRKKAKKTLR